MFDTSDARAMFATHNAQTIASIHHLARGRDFRFSACRMGDHLYAEP
jgi:RHH-type proline utilization regulon transcriptional repressor/proline dehydrogenase/delta 1-pyrroline-5-carboxylate dehydrogenase